jgi:hypothetical protein
LPLGDADIERINQTSCVILAGADQLCDDFCIVPGMTPQCLDRIKVPVIPMGVGARGHGSRMRGMSALTKRLMRMIHERITYSSWRCARTVEYLLANVPEIESKVLMTACPVQYQEPLMAGAPFTTPARRIAVTVTDRGKFWERDLSILRFVAAEFPNAQRTLALHQDYTGVAPRFKLKHLWSRPRHADELHAAAAALGYGRFHSESPEDFFAFYSTIDGHFGSRLHAHLYLLGQGKASYVVRVDDRAGGIAETSDFPLYDPQQFAGYRQYDFERYRTRVRSMWPVMRRFLESVWAIGRAP